MGCAASTTVANVDDESNVLRQQAKDDDVLALGRSAADSGDVSTKDANLFGAVVAEEDTNFHNSPSNVMNDPTSVVSNNIELSTDPGHLSAASTVSRNEEGAKSKNSNVIQGDGECYNNTEKPDDRTSQQELSQSISISRHSTVYKPTLNSSDDEESKLSTKISRDLSKQSQSSVLENNVKEKSLHNSRNSQSKSILSVNKTECEKSEKDSQSSHTLSGSNRSPYFDSINANADINQCEEEEELNKDTATQGDNNQNHQLNAIMVSEDYGKDECLYVDNGNFATCVNEDLLGVGDTCLLNLDQPIKENNDTDQFNGDLLSVPDKPFSMSRNSQISAISRKSSVTPSFKKGFLRTAEVNDANCEIESINGFEMRDMIVDFNQPEDEMINLSENNTDNVKHQSNEDLQTNQFYE